MKVARVAATGAAICAALAAAGALSGAESATRKACPTGGRTVLANGTVRVYRKVTTTYDRVYACLEKTGKVRKLVDVADDGGGVRLIGLARAHVAFDTASCGSSSCVGDMRTLDMRSGKLRRAPMHGDESFAKDLVVTDTGAVAWTRGTLAMGSDYEPRIYKLDAGGEGIVDSGPAVDLDSLATDGARLYWTSGDAPRSVALQ